MAAGKYARKIEVIRDGNRTLITRDRAVEAWLHVQFRPAYDKLKIKPARVRSIKQVRVNLAAVLDPGPAGK